MEGSFRNKELEFKCCDGGILLVGEIKEGIVNVVWGWGVGRLRSN